MTIRNGRVRSTAFTMVEMIVVVIIVGILAAVTTPIYRAQTRRARASEALTVLDAIRQAERAHYTETNSYLAVAANYLGNSPTASPNPGLGIDASKNTYYDAHCFTVTTDATYQFVAAANGGASGNAAPRSADVSTYRLEMRGNGTARMSYDSGTTFTSWQ